MYLINMVHSNGDRTTTTVRSMNHMVRFSTCKANRGFEVSIADLTYWDGTSNPDSYGMDELIHAGYVTKDGDKYEVV